MKLGFNSFSNNKLGQGNKLKDEFPYYVFFARLKNLILVVMGRKCGIELGFVVRVSNFSVHNLFYVEASEHP